MKDKINGLALSINPYRENDQLAKVFLQDGRLVSFVVKGANKVNGKNKLNELSSYLFFFDDNSLKDIFTLQRRQLNKSYYEYNMRLLSLKLLLLEAINKFKIEDKELYNNLIFVLDNLKDDNAYKLVCFLLNDLLKRNGNQIYTSSCVECNNTVVVAYSQNRGGFVCEKHYKNEDISDLSILKKIRHIQLVDQTNVLQLNEEYDEEILLLFLAFIKEHCDITLSAYSFYANVSNSDRRASVK